MPSPFDASRLSGTARSGIVADLHTHSTQSDGKKKPHQIVDEALERGLLGVAVSDHDEVSGSVLAIEHAAALECTGSLPHDLVTFNALEASTVHGAFVTHLLIYCPDPGYQPLHDRLRRTIEDRRQRTLNIMELLDRDGMHVMLDDFLERGWIVNRSNLGRLLVERGDAPSINWCFEHWFGDSGCPYYVPREDEPDTLDTIELGIAAGGVPVAAHPAAYHDEECLPEFAEAGMKGVEAFHPDQSPEDSERLLRQAEELGLFVTGGSDWHGDAMHGSDLGGCGLEIDRFLELIPHLPQDRVFHFKAGEQA